MTRDSGKRIASHDQLCTKMGETLPGLLMSIWTAWTASMPNAKSPSWPRKLEAFHVVLIMTTYLFDKGRRGM